MTDLILLHGALGASSQFAKLIPLLSKNYNVFTFDFYGHGSTSTEKDFSMQEFANQLYEFIHSNDLNQPNIFGYSMGGYVAYTLAIQHPNAMGTIISLGSKLKWDEEESKKEIKQINPDKIKEKVPKFADYLQSLHGDNWPELMRKTAKMIHGLGNGTALTIADFKKIKNNCFTGVGSEDEMVTREETKLVADAILNSEFYLLKKVHHPLPTIDSKVLAEKIKKLIG